jgi:hypothetical protein
MFIVQVTGVTVYILFGVMFTFESRQVCFVTVRHHQPSLILKVKALVT